MASLFAWARLIYETTRSTALSCPSEPLGPDSALDRCLLQPKSANPDRSDRPALVIPTTRNSGRIGRQKALSATVTDRGGGNLRLADAVVCMSV